MERTAIPRLFLMFFIFNVVSSGSEYDYSYTAECSASPLPPQYGGGMIVNPMMNEGLKGWSSLGGANITHRVSQECNCYLVVINRCHNYDSVSQEIVLDKEKFYTLSAWVQIGAGKEQVGAKLLTPDGNLIPAGWVVAQSGCWSMLKGGLVVNSSGPAKLIFVTNSNSNVDIWIDNVSIKPFSKKEWRHHQDQMVEKVRKNKVRIEVVDDQGQPLANAKLSISQTAQGFPFGCAMTNHILRNKAYQNWFTSRFKFTVFENEMKWYYTEGARGRLNYADADAMVQLCRSRGIVIRGHNVFWNNIDTQPSWVPSLSPSQLSSSIDGRIKSVMRRYAGQVIHWDVNNENMHYNFFDSKLGRKASAVMYRKAHAIDSHAIPFLNEYNTLEQVHDDKANPAMYLEKIREMRAFGYHGPLGIGLESHFGAPTLPYVRAGLDMLAAARLPIWITELDIVKNISNQAGILEQLLREFHAHPAIQGIMMWAAWRPEGCYRMCLTDNNFRNLPVGDVVDKILREWRVTELSGTTDGDGIFETSLFHGDYEVKVNHPTLNCSSMTKSFKVDPSLTFQTMALEKTQTPVQYVKIIG